VTDHETTCHACGARVVVPCDAKAKRHNRAGEGYHGAGEVTRLSALEIRILDILEGRWSWKDGLTSWGVYVELKKEYIPQERMPVVNTVRARLSTLAGKGLELVRVEKNRVEVQDRETMKFGFRGQERWFLSDSPSLTAVRLVEEARERVQRKQAVVAAR
jgi:hypothetical protein